ncbi:MAG: hypothetical protein KTR31_08805 [Myxococcales bacterium]|nr:hypothetical protein [Myxococcales bacterium]
MAPERRGRRNDPDPLDRARRREPEEEEEVQQEPEREGPGRDPMQDMLGNSGVAAILGLGGPQLGGDDDPDEATTAAAATDPMDPSAPQIQPLAESKGAPPPPRPRLGPADAEWLQRMRAEARGAAASSSRARWQPSATAALDGGAEWLHATLGPTGHDALLALLHPPAPVLQDRHGRVLHGRLRALAIAPSWLASLPCEAATHTLLLAELAARGPHLESGATPSSGAAGSPPSTPSDADAPVDPELVRALAQLLDAPRTQAWLPPLRDDDATPDPDEDPLGLDDVLQQLTGGGSSPQQDLADAAWRTVERLRAELQRLLRRGPGLVRAAADAARAAAVPVHEPTLTAADHALRQRLAETRVLLQEIGAAAQARTVAPTGLRTGLKRACRAIDQAVDQLLQSTASGLRAPSAAGATAAPEGRVVEALGACATSLAAADAVQRLAGVRAAATGPWLEAVDLVLGAATSDPAAAAAVAQHQGQRAWHAGDGLLLAASALNAMEATLVADPADLAGAEQQRDDAGRRCAALNAEAALQLLARWEPPPPRPEPRVDTTGTGGSP